jgi:FkbM family methyltransferase
MELVKLINFINSHPLAKKNRFLAMKRLIIWQLSQRLIKRPILMPFIDNSVLLVQKSMYGATGNIYTGLHEFEEMSFLLHFLQEEDCFFDIGANVGSYTILSSKVIGATTYSFEPSPDTYLHLSNNVYLNHAQDHTHLMNCGIGAEQGELFFTTKNDTTNHVLNEEKEGSIKVSIDTIDNICASIKEVPNLIKIDVEGFETKVINGASKSLKEPKLKAIIMELNGSGNRYGFDEHQLHQRMLDLKFKPYHYDPFERVLHHRAARSLHGNTIYVRDIEIVNKRLKSAKRRKVLGVEF